MSNRILCLSIRQPWAYLIVNGHKDIENRVWDTRYRGPILIHAGLSAPLDDYYAAYFKAADLGITVPARVNLERGGIVGMATVVDCVRQHDSPWFFGPIGWVLKDAKPLPFVQCTGQLGLFTPSDEVLDQLTIGEPSQ